MPRDIADAMRLVQLEDELRSLQLARQLRNFLAGALCAVCGEPLGEGRIVQIDKDGTDCTCHAECED
jgi:hypothetical protein